jgi:hypothetical protein
MSSPRRRNAFRNQVRLFRCPTHRLLESVTFFEIGADDVVQHIFSGLAGASVDCEYDIESGAVVDGQLFKDTHINLQTNLQLANGYGPVTFSGSSQPCCWAKASKRFRAMKLCVMR